MPCRELELVCMDTQLDMTDQVQCTPRKQLPFGHSVGYYTLEEHSLSRAALEEACTASEADSGDGEYWGS